MKTLNGLKENDCFIKRYSESYRLYKIKRYSDEYCSIESIFVSYNVYSYDIDKRKIEDIEDFITLEKYPVNAFNTLRDMIQESNNKAHEFKLKTIATLFQYIKNN